MKILVLNSGSSSLKFQLIETTPELIAADQDRRLAHGEISKIGSAEATVSFSGASSAGAKSTRPIRSHDEALAAAFECLTASGTTSLDEIAGVGHRVVHGSEHFQQSVIIDDEVVKLIESASELAPLHNPHNLKGYYVSKALLPHATHVAVFDTAFHQTLPPHAYLYGLPYESYTRDRIRRYGFHGTSHRYVSYRYAQIHGESPEAYKLITCHLGNGCSVCAIEAGKSVDTSMGLTPMEGLLMGTRVGDIDPGAVMYLAEREGVGLPRILDEQSGLLGVSGMSNDMRDLLAAMGKGVFRAALAIEVFCYRVTKYIGAYFAAMNGADAVIFAGGIGENEPFIRARICATLTSIGIHLDDLRNHAAVGKELEIGFDNAVPRVWVIPTDEELLIARDTVRAILKLPLP